MGEGDEGLYEQLKKEKKEKKIRKYKHIDSQQFKKIVWGYFEEGFFKKPKTVWKKIRRKFKVDGQRIELGDILALKRDFKEEEPDMETEDQPISHDITDPKSPEDALLKSMYDEARRNKDEKMLLRIQDKILGKQEEKKSFQDRIMEASIKRLEGDGRGRSDSDDDFSGALMKRVNTIMDTYDKMFENMTTRKGMAGGALSQDSGVALAQVIVPTIQDGFAELNDTARDLGGLKKKKRLTKGDEQKVEHAEKVLADMQKLQSQYIRCSKCGFIIPKVASQCSRCGVVFEPSREEVEQANQYVTAHGGTPQTPLTPEQITEKQKKTPNPSPDAVTEGDNRSLLSDAKDLEEVKALEEWFNRDDGKLYRLKRKIENEHDPVQAMNGIWAWLDEEKEEDKKLLFIAIKGIDFLLSAAKPHVDKYDQEELFKFYSTPASKIWVHKAFERVKEIAEVEEVVLDDEDIKRYEKELNPYLKSEIPATTECVICNEQVPIEELNDHFRECQKKELARLEAEREKKENEKKTEG